MQIANPMVEYLNSLRTQQQNSNSTYIHEARREFLHSLQRQAPWFPDESRLHIRTHLDVLIDDLVADTHRIRLLFLTGDAGDGKTAFCAALARRLGFDGELLWETVIGHCRIIKDASEVEEEVLGERIMAHLQQSSDELLIIAINEGRLRRLFRGLPLEGLWKEIVEPALEGWLEPDAAVVLDEAMRREHVIVINFRHRFHVRTVTPDLLETWTPELLWELSPACRDCSARTRCPILANVQDLRSPYIQQRIADVLTYSHFSGHRLPFRRLQAALAATTTGGLLCSDVRSLTEAKSTVLALLRHRYYNALFLREERRLPVAVRPEPIARTFAGADPGTFAVPDLDRRIEDMLGPQTEEPHWNEHQLPQLETEAIRLMRQRLRPEEQPEDIQDNIQGDVSNLTRFLRRWVMFVDGVPKDMPWRQAVELIESFADGRDHANKLKATVVEAINRLHRVDGLKTETITGNQIDAAGFRNPARQVLELNLRTEFSTSLQKGPALPEAVRPYLESAPTEIYLAAWPGDTNEGVALLRLDARLIEIFLSINSGFVAWQGLGAYRRAMARFHARLLALASRGGYMPAVTIRAKEKRYSVSVDTASGSPRLRFEGQG